MNDVIDTPDGRQRPRMPATGPMAAIGALGVAGAAALALLGPGGPGAPSDAERGALMERVCIDADIRMIDGLAPGCIERERLAALRDGAVMGSDGEPETVSLSHPSNPTAPVEIVRSCKEYDRLKAGGYYALSNREIRREGFFERACGVLEALEQARSPAWSAFRDGHMTPVDVEEMVSGGTIDFASFGEDSGERRPVDIAKTETGVWRVSANRYEAILQEIAHADFNGDGAGDILAFLSVGAVDGTARIYQLGLVERPTKEDKCRFRPLLQDAD